VNDFNTYADWYVWAKRNLSTDAMVCHGAAAAATAVVESGGDRQQAIAAARQSLTAAAHLDVADADIRRRTYAEWFDWARRELGGVREQQQAAAQAALSTLDAGRGANAAIVAARATYGAARVEPAAPAQASPGFPAAPAGRQPHPPYPQYQYGAPEPPSFAGYAGFWRRLAAYVTDSLVLLAAIIVVALIISVFVVLTVALSGRQVDTNAAANLMETPLQVISLALGWLYYTLLEASPWQATLGKRVLGIKVTDLEGGRISWGRANARFWSKILSSLILGIGYLMIAFTKRKQGLHDMIASTLVVRKT